MKGGMTRLKICWDCGKLSPCCAYICTDCARTREKLVARIAARERRLATRGILNIIGYNNKSDLDGFTK
jgi:hypothetical protein